MLPELELHVHDLLLLSQVINHSAELGKFGLGAVSGIAFSRGGNGRVGSLPDAGGLRTDIIQVLMKDVILLRQCFTPSKIREI